MLIPSGIQIESSTKCNSKCTFCPNGKLKRQKGEMTDDLFIHIMRQVVDLKINSVLLFLNGEPLIFNRLFEWLEMLRENKIHTGLFTNARTLDEDMSNQLIAFGDIVDYIIFSVPGATEETYNKLTGGGDLLNVSNKINRFLELNQNRIHTEVHFLTTLDTIPERDIFKAQWNKRVNSILIDAPFANFCGVIDDDNLSSKPNNKGFCRRIWNQFCIYWDGRVPLCCLDADAGEILGDVTKQSILEIWNNDKINQYRKAHLADDVNKLLCSKCNVRF